ncbi:hypothetical protein FPY71_11645 [Aureimonas fodinaquatilis]|uniref:Uncharacterized protein n=1 Tax=Aureimonas fodinaquatilis TaxID=2565783 RepID=A0A5B0DZB1_9HYPH|nr:hypothetical protein [Aureimonas fodinaquatilis]KAA0971091.1 hypothetical protein FPY71_11645 [Aureimonas fodinaquatilis]
MKTSSLPYIFRSLEKAEGRAGFDTVTLAAVAAYTALQRPTDHQQNALVSLIAANWPKLAPSTRRAIRQALCTAACIPAGLSALFAQDEAFRALPPAAASMLSHVRKTQLAQHRISAEQRHVSSKMCPPAQESVKKRPLLRNFGLLRQPSGERLIVT